MPPGLNDAVAPLRYEGFGRGIDNLKPGLVAVVRVPGEPLGETRRGVTGPDWVARQVLAWTKLGDGRRTGCQQDDKRKGSESSGHNAQSLDGKTTDSLPPVKACTV
jgi:hypothetical protein